MLDQYGKQLQVGKVDTYTAEGNALYRASVEYFNIPPERQGVPTMIIGDTVLVGSQEISEWLPRLVEEGLSAGGLDWPAIPGPDLPVNLTPEVDAVDPTTTPDTSRNVMLIVVLGWVVLSTGYVAIRGVRIWLKRRNSEQS